MTAPEVFDPEIDIQKKSLESARGVTEATPPNPREAAEFTNRALFEVLGGEAPSDMQSSLEAHFKAHPEVAAQVASDVVLVREKAARANALSEKLENVATGAAAKVEKNAPSKINAVLQRFLGGLSYYFSKTKRAERATSAGARREHNQAEINHIAEEAIAAARNIGSTAQNDTLMATVHQAFYSRRNSEEVSGAQLQEGGQRMIKQTQAKLKELLRGSNLDELQKAHEYFEILHKQGALEHFTVDGKAMNPEQLSLHINYLAAATVNTEMDARIEKLFAADDATLCETGYARLQEVLHRYVTMERLGSKKGKEVKAFFSKVLRAKLKEVEIKGSETKVALLGHTIRRYGL